MPGRMFVKLDDVNLRPSMDDAPKNPSVKFAPTWL